MKEKPPKALEILPDLIRKNKKPFDDYCRKEGLSKQMKYKFKLKLTDPSTGTRRHMELLKAYGYDVEKEK